MAGAEKNFKKLTDQRQGQDPQNAAGRKKLDSVDQSGGSVRGCPKLVEMVPVREGPPFRHIQEGGFCGGPRKIHHLCHGDLPRLGESEGADGEMNFRALHNVLGGGKGYDPNPSRGDPGDVFWVQMKFHHLVRVGFQVARKLEHEGERAGSHAAILFEGEPWAKTAFLGWPFLFPDRNYPMPLPPWKKVLVVDLGFLGDTVHSIPAIRAIAQTGARVDVMTTPVGADLLGMVPEVNRSWIIPLRKPSPPPWKNLGTLLAIRKERYDAAISFAGSDRNLFCTGWSGARERVAHLTGRNAWPSNWRLTRTISRRDRGQPVFEQRLSVLRDLGWEGANPGWAWAIPKEDEAWAKRQVSSPFLHLSISSASSPLNEWPLDAWSDVLHRVWEKAPETRVVVTGSGSRREIARQADLLSLAQDGRVQNFFDPLPMARFAALLRASQLHVGLDSGVLHLAMALGKPTVSLFRESVGRPGWEPRGAAHQIILRSCECAEAGQQKCSGGRALCLSRISPDEVARLVSESLNSTRTSG